VMPVCDYLSYWCRALRRHQGTTKLGVGVTGPVDYWRCRNGGCASMGIACTWLQPAQHAAVALMPATWTSTRLQARGATTRAGGVVASDDDTRCGGTATLWQQMTATAATTLDHGPSCVFVWSDVSGAGANYEKMAIAVNEQVVKAFQAAGGGVCAVGTYVHHVHGCGAKQPYPLACRRTRTSS
jgi:hypothetical protein